ncbi:MAG: hypothetical protein U0T69_11125 [Chitinophagales bacterium]
MGAPIAQIIGAIVGGIGDWMKIGIGAKQMKEGKQLAKELEGKRPVLDLPQAFKEKEGYLRNAAIANSMPGQTQMEQQVEGNTANQLRSIQDSAGSGIQALTAALVANNNQNKLLNQIGVESAQYQQQNKSNLYGLLGDKANLQQKMWEFNVLQPYLEKAQQAKALKEAGPQNIITGLKDKGESISSFGSPGGESKGAQSAQFNGGTGGSAQRTAATGVGGNAQSQGTFQPENAQMFYSLYNSGINPFDSNGKQINNNNTSGGYNWRF